MSDDSPVILHHSLTTPCWRNILPLLSLLLICQLLIRSNAYLLRNPRFVKLFFSFPTGSAGGLMACTLNIFMTC